MGLVSSTDITEAQKELSYLLGHKPILYRPHCFQLGRGLCDGIEGSGVTLVLGPVLHIVGNKKKNLGSEYLKTFEKLSRTDYKYKEI